MTTIRKTFTSAVAALALGATVAASATPAAADWRGHRGGHYRGGNGGAIAAGVIGGLALGALAAGSAYAAPRYYTPSYATPVYAGPAYDSSCYTQDQPAYDRWGRFRGYRQVTVCD